MHKPLIYSLFTLFLLSACAARPLVEFDPAADFSQYRSFSWQAPAHDAVDDPILDSPLLDAKVRQAVIDALQQRGLDFVAEGQADLLVTYHTADKQRSRPGSFVLGFGTGPWNRRTTVGYAVYGGDRHYEEGLLIIDLVDARNGQLVWRGWRGASLNQASFQQAGINEIVRIILSSYPPERG
ncbi:MAG: DUF4136 domain-containing protein [Gammaproteobacteria bacterium]|nr:DUF4136 domain-containing protein [Gammaproteobacteria bacterium]